MPDLTQTLGLILALKKTNKKWQMNISHFCCTFSKLLVYNLKFYGKIVTPYIVFFGITV